jgi:hypothetical protein
MAAGGRCRTELSVILFEVHMPNFVTPRRPVAVFAQSLAAAVLTRLGYQLAVPQDATLPFDLLGSRDPNLRMWESFQVKQSSRSGVVGLRRGDKRPGCKRYVSGDFDVLIVVDLEGGTYLIPYRAIQHLRTQVCVRDIAYRQYRVAEPLCWTTPELSVHQSLSRREAEQLSLFVVRAA